MSTSLQVNLVLLRLPFPALKHLSQGKEESDKPRLKFSPSHEDMQRGSLKIGLPRRHWW